MLFVTFVIKSASSAYKPVAVILHDLVGSRGKVQFLVLVVISGNDLAGALHECRIPVGAGLFADSVIEPWCDRLERIQLDQRILLPIPAHQCREQALILCHQRVQVASTAFAGASSPDPEHAASKIPASMTMIKLNKILRIDISLKFKTGIIFHLWVHRWLSSPA